MKPFVVSPCRRRSSCTGPWATFATARSWVRNRARFLCQAQRCTRICTVLSAVSCARPHWHCKARQQSTCRNESCGRIAKTPQGTDRLLPIADMEEDRIDFLGQSPEQVGTSHITDSPRCLLRWHHAVLYRTSSPAPAALRRMTASARCPTAKTTWDCQRLGWQLRARRCRSSEGGRSAQAKSGCCTGHFLSTAQTMISPF